MQEEIGQKHTTKNLHLLIHTQYGIVTFETDDMGEIHAAIDAIAEKRAEQQRAMDCRERKDAA